MYIQKPRALSKRRGGSLRLQASGIQIYLRRVRCNFNSGSILIVSRSTTGSWEGDIRIWKLDPKLKSFSLVGTVPAPGVVNSLQFFSPPKGFVQKSTWAAPKSRDSAGEASTDPIGRPVPTNRAPLIAVNPIALVAGIGQEHRLGRWIKMKGNGVTNCALVVAFSPRTAIN
jgi:ribosomal RNA-processing protein 9